jgi:hypothetical protein
MSYIISTYRHAGGDDVQTVYDIGGSAEIRFARSISGVDKKPALHWSLYMRQSA